MCIRDRDTYSSTSLYFIENEAEKGGGLYLEVNAKIYILKSEQYSRPFFTVKFTDNSANYGGAVYVSDDSCKPNYNSQYKAKECFFQILAVYGSMFSNFSQESMITKNIFFSQNYAQTSGSTLFGGLLHKCKVQYFTEFQRLSNTYMHHNNSDNQQQYHQHNKLVSAISYITNVSNINMSDIGSQPVQLCFCKGDLPDCNYQPGTIRVTKGKRFSVKLVAVDQVNHPVNATIHSFLPRTGGGLEKDQATQNTSQICTEVNFNLFSPYDREELIMLPEGPCLNSPQSQRRLDIQFTACDSCPIGFEKYVDEDTACECICDSKLEPFITKCNASTELLQREGNFRITYVNTGYNTTSGYLIYAHCPLNYCKPPTSKVEVNLNIPDGADVQCANGHSGTLCGTCQWNFSLSLGSSRCIPCSTHWPTIAAILIVAFLAGIALVTFVLVLNLTVAVGTLNGIIFYANIVNANSSTFLPFSKPNFVSVFISWLNLEIGFDTCFFEGMDTYWKTLLQLAFPMYVIFLVVMVIFISERSTKFARLVAKKNPVATLTTLILLSYAKFLNSVIASVSYATLIYPDGSHHRVWLPDATVEYLKGKHIVLFTIAILILLAGVAYTTLLFFWQWLLHHQDKKIFSWTRHQKLCHFIEPYHAPYTFEQRYWTGLLLFVRVILYIISAVNLTGDPQVSLVSTIILVGLLPTVKGILERKIYKKWPIDAMEMIIYFNIIAFTTLTLKTGTSKNKEGVAYTSIMITFVLFLVVIVFHMFQYTCLCSATKKVKTLAVKLLEYKKRNHTRCTTLPDEEDNQSLITHSFVEVPRPHLEQQELALQKEKENTLTVSSHVVLVDDETRNTAPPLDSTELDPQTNTEADEIRHASLSTQITTTTTECNYIDLSTDVSNHLQRSNSKESTFM